MIQQEMERLSSELLLWGSLSVQCGSVPGMPYYLNGPERAELIAAAVTRLLGEGGQAAVTTRAIAEATGVGMSSLANHFGGRRRLMSVSCHLSGMAHVRRIHERMAAHGIAGLVADDDESRARDRAWLAWTDLGRFDDHLGYQVADIEARETYLIGGLLGAEATRDDAELLSATVRGVRAAVCRLVEPMTPGEARRLLRTLARHLGQEQSAASPLAG